MRRFRCQHRLQNSARSPGAREEELREKSFPIRLQVTKVQEQYAKGLLTLADYIERMDEINAQLKELLQ